MRDFRVPGAWLRYQFQSIGGFFKSRDGTVGKDQFILFARAEIFNNRVKQWLMDIQFVRYSSALFEIVGGDVIRVADDINWYGIDKHAPIIRRSEFGS
jgi:hypothetical protein